MDVKSLYIILFVVLMVQALALYQTWRVNREEVGIRDWSSAAALLCLAMIMATLIYNPDRPYPTDPATVLFISLANAASATGYLLIWVGVRKFFRQPAPGYVGLVGWYVLCYVLSNLELILPVPEYWRLKLMPLIVIIILAMTFWEFFRSGRYVNPTIKLILAVLSVMLLSISGRWIALLAGYQLQEGFSLAMSVAFSYASIMSSVILTPAIILMTNERINRRLKDMALKDPLTGALNRRAFFESADAMIADLKRHNGCLAVCLIDIDHFKRINDIHGHAVGDRVLSQFADIARNVIRETDVFARYGGEEFVVLMPGSSAVQAAGTMDRLKQQCGRPGLFPGNAGISFSAGVVEADDSGQYSSMDKLLESADRVLYQAKHEGRNRVVLNASPA
ncbi:MAG: GGDEF domain-containing protein [Gammaproteobacteria bacterium]|nr:GGDEF domain-containing protein [Gammaproteobacteria bacterium]